MATITVQVIEEDYVLADCDSATNCVLARAIQRATKDSGWNVDGDAVTHPLLDKYALAPQWFDDAARFADVWLKLDNGPDPIGMDCALYHFEFDPDTGKIGDKVAEGTVELGTVWGKRKVRGVPVGILPGFLLVDGDEDED